MTTDMSKETLEFIGNKSHTLSFRLRTYDLMELLGGKSKVVSIRGQKFIVQKYE